MLLNPKLIEKQGIDEVTVLKIEALHHKKDELFTQAEKWLEEGDLVSLEKGAKELEQIEFNMQELWGFEKDSNYHTHWLHYPGCKCPYMDNTDDYGYRRIINCSCPAHGYICKGEENES